MPSKLGHYEEEKVKAEEFDTKYYPTWCPGCGDFGIWAALKAGFYQLGWTTRDFVVVYGIGCSGNMNDFLEVNGFHALHGRALPVAEGIKLANHKLNVLCVVGDGDCYGEGGNHLLHSMRGNHDIKVFVHDNRVYGLTTGQVSPTAAKGFRSKSTPSGVVEIPLNPLTLALTQGATFVAQGFSGDIPQLTELVKTALKHRGFALLNVLQPCVTFNKVNTYQWFREKIEHRTYNIKHLADRKTTLAKIMDILAKGKIPVGIIYQNENERPAYHQEVDMLKDKPLVEQAKSRSVEISSLLSKLT